MEVTPDKRQRARELADEFLGRGATIARATVSPLDLAGRVALAAGLVIWIAGPAPFWHSAPSLPLSLVLLALLLAPGLRLLRHRRRMQTVLDDLPGLVDNLTSALQEGTSGVGALPGHWRDSGQPGKSGLLATGKRCYTFYRQDLGPIRAGPGRVVGQVTDALASFNAPALMLSGAALLAGIVEVILAPIAMIIRLIL
jgi:hypothetical protein